MPRFGYGDTAVRDTQCEACGLWVNSKGLKRHVFAAGRSKARFDRRTDENRRREIRAHRDLAEKMGYEWDGSSFYLRRE